MGSGEFEVNVPESIKKMIRSVKEIVGGQFTDAEIYAMLKDSNMDPNDAVSRLLTQDPFHEVKSKREKKKENKYTYVSKPRGGYSRSSRGGRGGSGHYVANSGTQFSSYVRRNPAYKKEDGSDVYASQSVVSSGTTGNDVYDRPQAYSESVTAGQKARTTDTVHDGWPSSQPTSGVSQPSENHHVWGAGTGQLTMADIVKRGVTHSKASNLESELPSNESYNNVNTSEVSLSKVSRDDVWPVVEPSSRNSHAVQPASGWHTDVSHWSSNESDRHPEPEEDEVLAAGDEYVNYRTNHDENASIPLGRTQNYTSEGASLFSNDVHENLESYQPHPGPTEYWGAEDIGVSVSSMASNLQQLNIVNEQESQQEEEDVAVVIPDHLQVQSTECMNLSFGSFRSLGTGTAASISSSSRPTYSYMEAAHADEDAPSAGQWDTRNSDYYVEESLRSAADGNLVHGRAASGTGPYDLSSLSQLEVLNHENNKVPNENQYTFPASNYTFENAAQLNPPSQAAPRMQTFSNQAYTNTLPSGLLPQSTRSMRESDYLKSKFAMGQSMPSKYGNAVSSVSSSTLSIEEVLKAAGFSTPQSVRGNNIEGPALTQHRTNQYSEMTQLKNLMDSQHLPQDSYLPGGYMQKFAGKDSYHQSIEGMIQQYQNSVSQSAAVASEYGGNFGNSNSYPGNFPTNQPSGRVAATVGYEDVLGPQYNDINRLLSLQQAQNEQQSMWASRTSGNKYYPQQQHPPGFRQAQQQPSQNYGAPGSTNVNTNFYHPQQNLSARSQLPAGSQQSQNWQNSY